MCHHIDDTMRVNPYFANQRENAMRERIKPIRLRLYRHNGEYVRCMDVDSVAWDDAKELVWRYLGDISKRTEIAVSVWDDWNDPMQPGQCVLRLVTLPSGTEYTVRWQQ